MRTLDQQNSDVGRRAVRFAAMRVTLATFFTTDWRENYQYALERSESGELAI